MIPCLRHISGLYLGANRAILHEKRDRRRDKAALNISTLSRELLRVSRLWPYRLAVFNCRPLTQCSDRQMNCHLNFDNAALTTPIRCTLKQSSGDRGRPIGSGPGPQMSGTDNNRLSWLCFTGFERTKGQLSLRNTSYNEVSVRMR